MNILPKKSWHVLSRDNIQRVRRDEAEAKAKEEEKQRRAEIAEREARLNLMRKRAHERDGFSDGEEEPVEKEAKLEDSSQALVITTERGHINFFADIKQGVGMQTTNVDHDKEKKDEKEKFEKRIGLLNYLVDKDKSDDPWYSKSGDAEESVKSKRIKGLMDPLNDMKHFISQTKKHSAMAQSTSGASQAPLIATPPGSFSLTSFRSKPAEQSPDSESSHTREKRKSHDHKHHKSGKQHKKSKLKHKKKKEEEREKDARLEELRRQRRKREEAERAKAETLLRLSHGKDGSDGQVNTATQIIEDTAGRYNSQFNPHLVRQRYK